MKVKAAEPKNEDINPPRRKRRIRPITLVAAKPTQTSVRAGSRKSTFKKVDISRAISAAKKGGATVSGLEIKADGAIRLAFDIGQNHSTEAGDLPYDEWADRL